MLRAGCLRQQALGRALRTIFSHSGLFFFLFLPIQGSCGDSGDPGEYNLRSRTVVCSSCGQPADKSGSQNAGLSSMSSGSSSSVTVTRSYRSLGGSGGGSGLGENLVTRSYILGSSSPRRQVSGVTGAEGSSGTVASPRCHLDAAAWRRLGGRSEQRVTPWFRFFSSFHFLPGSGPAKLQHHVTPWHHSCVFLAISS